MLRGIHDRINAEVAAAFARPVDLSDDDILHRLVALSNVWGSGGNTEQHARLRCWVS